MAEDNTVKRSTMLPGRKCRGAKDLDAAENNRRSEV